MNIDDKSRFDAILELNKQCWARMEQRRTYEWRVAFAIWGVIVGLIGLLFSSSLDDKWGVFVGILGLGILISILHLFWLRELTIAMGSDRNMAIHYGGMLQEITKSQFPIAQQKELDKRQADLGKFLSSWSVRYEWFATIIMVIAALLVAAFRIWG